MRDDLEVRDDRKLSNRAFKTGAALVVAGILLIVLFKVLGFVLHALVVFGVVLVLASFLLPYFRGKR